MTSFGNLIQCCLLTMLIGIRSFTAAWANDQPSRYTETIQTADGVAIDFEMVLLPGGVFTMGSPADEAGRRDDEGPQRRVSLSPYYLSSTEVTLELFLAYYREARTSQPVSFPDPGSDGNGVDAVSGPTPVYGDLTMGRSQQHPATGMTWMNATAFTRWLSEKTGRDYRLPTEAEWESACRVGRKQTFGITDEPGELDQFAWFTANSHRRPHEVGTKQASPYGLFDMQGNVREWVQDFYSADAYSAAADGGVLENPRGPDSGRVHVARGGDHRSPALDLRCAARDYERKWWRSGDPQLPRSRWWLPSMDHIGIRIASTAQGSD